MDPDTTLAEIRSVLARLAEIRSVLAPVGATDDGSVDDLLGLAERVEALDDWVSKGGFLPTDWNARRR